MSAADLSVAMLKKSLEANGLASYGTKEEMLERLLAGGTKKKPGPKAKDVPKKKATKKADTSATKPTAGQIKLPQPLDATQAVQCALKLVGTMPSPAGGVDFVYEPITPKATKATKAKAAAKTKPAAAKTKPTKAKRDRDESDGDSDGDSNGDESDGEMEWACDVSVTRLVKKAKKEHIAALCGDYGVSVSGTKQELAENLAEQLHYETDESGDEEDEE